MALTLSRKSGLRTHHGQSEALRLLPSRTPLFPRLIRLAQPHAVKARVGRDGPSSNQPDDVHKARRSPPRRITLDQRLAALGYAENDPRRVEARAVDAMKSSGRKHEGMSPEILKHKEAAPPYFTFMNNKSETAYVFRIRLDKEPRRLASACVAEWLKQRGFKAYGKGVGVFRISTEILPQQALQNAWKWWEKFKTTEVAKQMVKEGIIKLS